jgi:hypothetical protein
MGPHWGGGAHARNRLMPNQPVRQRAGEASSLLSPLTLCVSLYVWERMRVCVFALTLLNLIYLHVDLIIKEHLRNAHQPHN